MRYGWRYSGLFIYLTNITSIIVIIITIIIDCYEMKAKTKELIVCTV